MRGVIENLWENESKNGQQYMTVQIGGERYSVWDTKYFDQLREGAEIEYDVKESGNFKHLNDIRPIERHYLRGNGNGNSKDRQITRMSCLKSASEILAPLHMELDVKRDMVIDTARCFERYVQEDDARLPSEIPGGNGEGKG
ncbi:hypothetical protein ACFL4V_00180 [Candidatus Latescibacterota bacterium]